MDPNGSAHRRRATTARLPMLPPDGRGDGRGGSAAAPPSSHVSTALGSGGGAPSPANLWTVAANDVTAASSAAASASGFGRVTAAAAAAAPAAYPHDVGGGVCSIPGGGSMDDPRRFPQRLPPLLPTQEEGTRQPLLPPFSEMFPAGGSASPGHVVRTWFANEEEKKSKRAGGARAEGPPTAEERASKRRSWPEGAITGDTGGGGDAGGGWSGQTALPTPAFVSPRTDEIGRAHV